MISNGTVLVVVALRILLVNSYFGMRATTAAIRLDPIGTGSGLDLVLALASVSVPATGPNITCSELEDGY